jgi:hypothetical protein
MTTGRGAIAVIRAAVAFLLERAFLVFFNGELM